ncbi:hypothetical protein PIB30_104609, partial [Stylosanthes scabra]|nr:hypothetical protein [Stylosanthes scabra]
VTFGLGEKPSTKRDLIFITMVFGNCWTSHGWSRLGLGLAKPKRDMMYAWGGFALVMLNGGRSRLKLCMVTFGNHGSRLSAWPKRELLECMGMSRLALLDHEPNVTY